MEAARVPAAVIEIVPRVEELEEIDSSEIAHRLNGGAFHFNANGTL